MTTKSLPVAFLGFCERAAYVREGNTNIFKWNIVGLKNIIVSHIFPMQLSGFYMGLAVNGANVGDKFTISITDENSNNMGMIDFSTLGSSPDPEEIALKSEGQTIICFEHGWLTAFMSLNKSNFVILKPGNYYINLVDGNTTTKIGQLQFAVINPPPLTVERIAAIKSDPSAIKAVRMDLGCKKCPATFKIYAALEPNEKLEKESYVPYNAIPDEFKCDCGTIIDLQIIRNNLHGLLGHHRREHADLSPIPLYERSVLENIKKHFVDLLNSESNEEVLQKFIEENPILLQQFPSNQLFFKPPILTYYKADFAITTPQKELILVEIEKATTKLMKKDGGVSADLQHAFDQVRNWLHKVDEHRVAVLDSLGIEKEDVSIVKGVVIAGRDSGYDAQHLRQLKGNDWGRFVLLTYDDLLFGLDDLIRKMTSL